jgi:hypothetical protein
MEVSDQLHAAAALSPEGKVPGTHWVGGWVSPQKRGWALWWSRLYLEVNSYETGWLYPAHSGDERRNDSRLWRQGVLPCTCSRSIMQLAHLTGLCSRYKDAVDERGIFLPVHCFLSLSAHKCETTEMPRVLRFISDAASVRIVVASKCR